MQSSIYVALAAQRVLQQQLVTIANNVANMNTAGFRAESVNFDSLVSNAEADGVSFPSVGKTAPSTQQGTLDATGNPLDISLSGPGWLAIQTPGGVAYTRDGRLKIDAFGELRTVNDHSLLDASLAPIIVNPVGGKLEISPDGRIRQDGQTIGDVGVFDVPEQSLNGRFENSAFYATTEGLPIAPGKETKIAQGFVESSNVDPIAQMANLIAVSRTFESLNSTIKDSEDAMSRSVRELGAAEG